jgi:hypothetical protein
MMYALDELKALALRYAASQNADTAIPRLQIRKSTETTGPLPVLCEATLCFILQGAKRAMIGDQVLQYGASEYFFAAVEVPALAQVDRAGSHSHRESRSDRRMAACHRRGPR